MFRLQTLLLCTFLFAFKTSTLQAQVTPLVKNNKGSIEDISCINALRADKMLVEALEKMNLPSDQDIEKTQIDFSDISCSHSYSPCFKSIYDKKIYPINVINVIDAIDSARAFRNLWSNFSNVRNQLIATANEVSLMMQSHDFDIHEIHKIIIDKLLQMYEDLQNRYPIQTKKAIPRDERNDLVEGLSLIEKEQHFREEGYSDSYVSGLDHVNANLKLAQSLRIRGIDPYISHIPEFANLIDVHINFIERGIKSYKFPDEIYRLEQLGLLKTEAQSRRNSRQVTYRWWFNFNLRLSILATYFVEGLNYEPYRKHFTNMTNDELEYFL